MNEVVEVLKAARAAVAKGWCKNSLEDSDGNVCALGALKRAVQGDAQAMGPFNTSDFAGRSITTFNNTPTTGQQDVLNWFEKALADLGGLL